MPDSTASWVDDGSRSVVAAVAAAAIGVAADRGRRLDHASGSGSGAWSRPPSGSPPATTPSPVATRGGGLEGRLGTAINAHRRRRSPTRHDRATIDRLTGVANRQALLAACSPRSSAPSRYERPLCVAFVDIDHFKAVNDTYGHASGDIVLRGVAQTIAENLRASDLIGRYGGEEFMLILTETDVEEGAALSEKLRKLVERQRFSVEGNPDLSVTISIGIAGGIGPAAPDGHPRPRRRCRDVLGQVARAQPDLHLRRARRGRPRPARADLRRRTRRARWRSAGRRARRPRPR